MPTPFRANPTPGFRPAPGVPPAAYGQPKTSGKSVASLVLGIVGCTLWWLPFLGLGMILVDILAVVLGAMGMKEADRSQGRVGGKGMAITGLVLGIIGLAFWLIIVIIIGIVVAAAGTASKGAGA